MAHSSNSNFGPKMGLLIGVVCVVGLGLWLSFRAQQRQQLAQNRLQVIAQLLHIDRPEGYRELLDVAHKASDEAPGDAEIEASAAYAAALMALEYHVPELAKEARKWLALVARSPQEGRQSAKSASLMRCAEALMVWADGDLDQARAELAHLGAAPMQGPYPALEALRLTLATKQSAQAIATASERLEINLDQEARGWVYLGLYALTHQETARAQRAFDAAAIASPRHTGARMGQLWLKLGDNRPDHDHAEIADVAHEIDAVLADEGLAGPERAMALVVRARARQLEGESNLALRDIAEAQHVCPGHPFLELPDILPRPSTAPVPVSPRAAGSQEI